MAGVSPLVTSAHWHGDVLDMSLIDSDYTERGVGGEDGEVKERRVWRKKINVAVIFSFVCFCIIVALATIK